MRSNCSADCCCHSSGAGIAVTTDAVVMALDNSGQGNEDPQSDAIWILSSTFIVFTMQSGFGLLESGSVSVKNELNIMVKNAVDVVFGGLTYWAFGYGFSFGEGEYSNLFVGWGNFFVTADSDKLGWIYSKFFFQASFATTATTIVSGAMAERTKLTSYMLFSMVNTVMFSLPAHWVWATKGWLYEMGVVDIAGAGPVHLVGGVTGLVATLLLKPRYKRYERKAPPQMSSPTNAVLGMFMLWWGWLGFNCGSTFGISGVKWKLAARSAASTLCASVAGGVAGLALSHLVKDRKFDVTYMINGILGSLVSVTAICALVQPWEGLIIGAIGSLIANGSVALLDKLKIDDPVGCVGTHAMSGVWGLLAAGLFARSDDLLGALYLHNVKPGLFYGGGFHQLGTQALAVLCISVWSLVVSFFFLKALDFTIGLRVSLVEEIIGADIVEHGIGNFVYDRKQGRLLMPEDSEQEYDRADPNGFSAFHERQLRLQRDRSLSNFHHLLGRHNTQRTAAEINSEIRRESVHFGTANGVGPSHQSNNNNHSSTSFRGRRSSGLLNRLRQSKRRKPRHVVKDNVTTKNNNVIKQCDKKRHMNGKASTFNRRMSATEMESGQLIYPSNSDNECHTTFSSLSESTERKCAFDNEAGVYMDVLNEVPTISGPSPSVSQPYVAEADAMTHI